MNRLSYLVCTVQHERSAITEGGVFTDGVAFNWQAYSNEPRSLAFTGVVRHSARFRSGALPMRPGRRVFCLGDLRCMPRI